MYDFIPDNPYLLLTPGPLSTSKGVRNALLRDWCTWDDDYNKGVVQKIRSKLLDLATKKTENYTVVLMQGSGSFSVEACLGTVLSPKNKILIITNGAYGKRMVHIAQVLKLNHVELAYEETELPQGPDVEEILARDPEISHVAMVHCETTTGILNPLEEIAAVVKKHHRSFLVDAMSSFGGIPLDMEELGIDYLISSANKCIQGVPGFAFVIARKSELEQCQGNAPSLCLDLYDQWKVMDQSGKWRYTSPTHTVRAFDQALKELEEEGGVTARHQRYQENQRLLVEGMRKLGFKTLLPDELHSPIITSFLYPDDGFDFVDFYHKAKDRGFVLYPGKISQADTFRIGNIGEIYPEGILRLIDVIQEIRR